MGFLASAVLPADAYLVSLQTTCFPSLPPHDVQKKRPKNSQSTLAYIYSSQRLASLRLPHRRHQWLFRMHPAPTWLAIIKHPLNSGSRPRNCNERFVRRARPDRRRVDIQGQ